MQEEIWKDIDGYGGWYQVSSFGRVRSIDRHVLRKDGMIRFTCGVIFKPGINPKGYYGVSIGINNIRKTRQIHRLVAETFIPNPENKPQVNHKDGNKLNNNVENLEWTTQSENMLHAYKNGLKKPAYVGLCGNLHHNSKPVVMLSLDGIYIREYESANLAKIDTGISQGSICHVCCGDRNMAGGYRWMFASDYYK